MPIPQSQLVTWSHQGATVSSSAAYNSIRTALMAANSPLNGKSFEIFLQGSYGNGTNIYGDSDVDVVVFYRDTFVKDLSWLSPQEQAAHNAAYIPATYRWANLRDDTFSALQGHFKNNAVHFGKKSIKVRTPYGNKESDVVPAIQFRKYSKFISTNDMLAHWGIQFFDSQGNAVVNYPKYHIDRGVDKNSDDRTAGQYKATVRIFKNLRTYMVDHGLLADKVAPSYFIECLLHNVPDNLFIGQYSATVPAIINHLMNTPHAPFLCQNGVTKLIGPGSTEWPEKDFVTFISTASVIWENW